MNVLITTIILALIADWLNIFFTHFHWKNKSAAVAKKRKQTRKKNKKKQTKQNKISEKSKQRSGSFYKMNIETTFRFHTGISHDEEEQPKRFLVPSGDHIKEMTKKKNSKNTENNTNFALRVLESFCNETHTSFTDINNSNLDVLLSKLYISARTSKGENCKLNSLKSLRYGLQRYFLKE